MSSNQPGGGFTFGGAGQGTGFTFGQPTAPTTTGSGFAFNLGATSTPSTGNCNDFVLFLYY